MALPDVTNRNVLLADDDHEDFLIFSIAVKETRFAVALTHVSDGELLLKQLELLIPDILFLDLNMPLKDGRQCLKEIRQHARYDALPIIVYSAFNDVASIEYCFREGGSLYAAKPSKIGDLTRMLHHVFSIDWKPGPLQRKRSDFVIHSRGSIL
jgi:CheY-like chemotaxis protein